MSDEGRGAPREPIAIVGMACIFPGAGDLNTYWRNIVDGVDAITDVPEHRWEPEFYDPKSSAVDRFYCRRGGFVDEHASFDALGFGIMPVAAQGAEPDQMLTLQVAAQALTDAGLTPETVPRERTAVVIGRGNYVGAGMTRLMQHVRTAQQLVVALRTLVPDLTEAQLSAVKAEFQSQLGGYGPDTAIGLVPNLTASRIANRLDLQGPAYTVDAACASALVAVDNACRELRDGRADLALAGGVHLSHDVAFWSVFCQLGALSRSECIRPFDERADGLLIGEGLGVVALERLSDAMAAGRRIYAVIEGVGVASDGRDASIMNPRVEGQLLALERAWADAGRSPDSVGLVEAHGTGTKAGDAAELQTLSRFFGPTSGDRATLGSVKSNIGHTMPAAGAAGLIKAALSVYHRQLPPSLHCDRPAPTLADTRFKVRAEAASWDADERVAGVNAFGFGGINAHVVLRSVGEPRKKKRGRKRKDATGSGPETLAYFSASTADALRRQLEAGPKGELTGGRVRLVMVDPSPARRARAAALVAAGEPVRGRDGMWFSPGDGLLLDPNALAFMYPGVEAVFEPRVRGLADALGEAVPERLLTDDLEYKGYAVVWLGRLLNQVFERAGVRGHHMMGHSIGEWSAMIATGSIPERELDAFLESVQHGTLEVPGAVFVAAGASVERVRPLLKFAPEMVVSHDNCPHQVILCGPETAADTLLPRLRKAGILSRKLPFRSGFHAPVFEPYIAPHQEHLRRLNLTAADRPLWSATTCDRYPNRPEAIERLAIDHLVEPVRYRELTEAVYRAGARVFVQMGSGSLVGFVDDTLRSRDHLAISASVGQRTGLEQIRRVMGALWVEGLELDLSAWDPAAVPSRKTPSLPLQLGVPLVQLSTPLEVSSRSEGARPPTGSGGLLGGFAAVMRDVERATREVEAAVSRRGSRPPVANTPKAAPARMPTAMPAREAVTTRRLSVKTHPSLLDHSLIPQPAHWHDVADRNPVVPMTMMLEMMREAAVELVGGVAIGLRRVRARKWLAVHPAVEVKITAKQLENGRVKVVLDGYSEGEVVMADAYPGAPAPELAPLENPRPPRVTAAQLYEERWMFHGPWYQSVASLDSIADGGIDGTLTALEPSGALLDAAGQLFGYWVMEKVDVDRLAMPVAIDALDWFADEPAPDVPVHCRVRSTRFRAREVAADLDMVVNGRMFCRIRGWMDWRFDVDRRLWPVMQRTEDHLLSYPQPDGWVRHEDGGRAATATDYLLRRYCNASERATFAALEARRQVRWLRGLVAIKDAVRAHVRETTGEKLFPVEIALHHTDAGAPTVQLHGRDQTVHVSLSHKGNVSLAMAGNEPLGLDFETLEQRTESFARLAFTADELALIADRTGDSRQEWFMRLWCAKEAVGKAHGTGLDGRPKAWVTNRIEGERIFCHDRWVETRLTDDGVVAWTASRE